MKPFMGGNVALRYSGMKLEKGNSRGPEMVQITTNKVRVIKQRMKEAQDREKSYSNTRSRPLKFQIGDRVFLKVAP
jgi:hypothetical protein